MIETRPPGIDFICDSPFTVTYIGIPNLSMERNFERKLLPRLRNVELVTFLLPTDDDLLTFS
jgi:hypothetical protein